MEFGMNKQQFLMICLAAIISMFGCRGPFPSQTKEQVPQDHTLEVKGVMHKPGLKHPYRQESGCASSDCHQDDLDGGVARVEGETRIAPSCFQCHATKWEDDE